MIKRTWNYRYTSVHNPHLNDWANSVDHDEMEGILEKYDLYESMGPLMRGCVSITRTDWATEDTLIFQRADSPIHLSDADTYEQYTELEHRNSQLQDQVSQLLQHNRLITNELKNYEVQDALDGIKAERKAEDEGRAEDTAATLSMEGALNDYLNAQHKARHATAHPNKDYDNGEYHAMYLGELIAILVNVASSMEVVIARVLTESPPDDNRNIQRAWEITQIPNGGVQNAIDNYNPQTIHKYLVKGIQEGHTE